MVDVLANVTNTFSLNFLKFQDTLQRLITSRASASQQQHALLSPLEFLDYDMGFFDYKFPINRLQKNIHQFLMNIVCFQEAKEPSNAKL